VDVAISHAATDLEIATSAGPTQVTAQAPAEVAISHAETDFEIATSDRQCR
jgi:hypothetical protein